MVQRYHGERVDIDVFLEAGPRYIFHQRVCGPNPGIRNDNVKVVNTVLLNELLDKIESILLNSCVVLDRNQIAPLALGKIGKCF